MPIDGFACGVLVKSEMGRPIKIEGNPAHPASLGATDIFGQAALLGLYDPDRSQLVTRGGRIETWEHFQTLALDVRESLRAKKGAGLRILTQTVASPTLADQLHRLLEQFPEAKWHAYEPVTRDAIRAGCRLAFGEDLEPVHHLEKADVIVSLEADFLAWGPARLKDARAFAARRDAGDGGAAASMNRLYVDRVHAELSPGPRPITGWPSPSRTWPLLRGRSPPHSSRRTCRRQTSADPEPDRRACRLDQGGGARPERQPGQEPGHRR